MAAHLAGGVVAGKQTLVKILSLLQLEGFPVELRFKEFARGPHTFEIDNRAAAAADLGYLKLQTTQLGGVYGPRCDYELTQEGQKMARECLEQLVKGEDGEIIEDILEEFSSKHNIHRHGNMLSRYIHDLLTWEDEDMFVEEFRTLHDWFEKKWERMEAIRPEDDENLLVQAAVETVVVTFRTIEPKLGEPVTPEQFVGIRFAHYNGANIKEDLIAFDRGMKEEEVIKRLRRHLFAFESNSVRYGFLDEIDDDELDGLLQEAGRSHSGLET